MGYGTEWQRVESNEVNKTQKFTNMETKKFVIIETSLQYQKLVSIIVNLWDRSNYS